MRVVAFGITLVGVSVVGLGVVHKLLAYLLIDVVNGLASAICMARCAPSSRPRPMRRWLAVYSARHGATLVSMRRVTRPDGD